MKLNKVLINYCLFNFFQENAKHHFNCENQPIVEFVGETIKTFSIMPLHLFLGLGTQALDIIENLAKNLDNSVRYLNTKSFLIK